MLILLIRFQHFIFHFDLSVSEFFENLDVFVGVLIQRNPLIIIFIKVIHDLTGQLFRLVRRHTIFSYQMIFYLLKIDEAVAGTLAVVSLVDFVELDSQFHLHSVVEFLFTFELRLRLQMLLLVPNLLPLFHLFFLVDGPKIIAHILRLFRVFYSHFGLRMHILPIYLEIVKVHCHLISSNALFVVVFPLLNYGQSIMIKITTRMKII